MAIPSFINTRLIFEPMNWLVIGVIATIWLLAFHTVVKGFTAMQSTGGGAGQAPGQTPVAGPAAPFNNYEGIFAPS